MPVPVAAIAERRLLTHLMRADAVSPASAIALDSLPWAQGRRLVRLRDKGVIKEAQPGAFYLHVPTLADHLIARRRRAALAMAAVLGLFALTTLFFTRP